MARTLSDPRWRQSWETRPGVVPMRIGNTEIRPLGGGPGCLAMILVSVVGSILLTLLLNLGLLALG
ncbi:hypothetical protein SAMN05445756_1785 [Kytococcus aerolatus]|uniref:Uncharacterized protein n=1 Tax=Kytococcus aerolatus TaxID=592308 RepID=A0A212U1Z8_9MICO|nr:hypothetical protein SAMN05445756_1785 [Kytococcus aerolatus]